MTLTELKSATLQRMGKYPELKTELREFFYLAVSEIEEGGSEMHECELAINDMDEIIKEFEEKNVKKLF